MASPPAVVDSEGYVTVPARMPKWAHDRLHMLKLTSKSSKTLKNLAGELIVKALLEQGLGPIKRESSERL